jgi:hypothetical protein
MLDREREGMKAAYKDTYSVRQYSRALHLRGQRVRYKYKVKYTRTPWSWALDFACGRVWAGGRESNLTLLATIIV